MPLHAKQDSGEHKTWQLHYSAIVTVGDRSETFSYFCGYGCARETLKKNERQFRDSMEDRIFKRLPLSSYAAGIGYALATKGTDASRYTDKKAVAEFMQWLCRNHTPDAASLIDCLKLDSSLGEDSFSDFCGNIGADEDSRKAEASWRECQESGRKLRSLLGHTAFAQLLDCESL